ncbi:phosphate ABC transporter substrate-binding protein PstS [Gemmatimonas sp.]|uniref:phosphate ABC transporter substrate-binding protein PstS n=1 Tax=Gemmatimonas sp. TaxID=1962908 RepID=UPI00286DB809|nr:phosphate ABC transporter substrate-binding protein PstS [Gemmatimonas sp.]
MPRLSISLSRIGLPALVLAALAMIAACGDRRSSAVDSTTALAPSGTRVDLTGAGATFPYPLYSRWFNEYATLTNVRINYQSIGSGGGIRQVVARTVDFGATDVPMTDAELASAGMPVLHIPTVIGAVAITYNLPGLSRPLNLSPDVIADIFLGTITRWSDARITALNPNVTMPDTDILVVHRADGSGTSYIFSDFLTTVSPAWAAGPGRGKDVRWPVGIGGKGNEGVAGQVKQMPGAVGYLEVVYARQNRLPVVHVRNAAGRFISPMPFEIASAATAVLEADRKLFASDAKGAPDLRVSLVNAPGAQSYPIASFTWMLVAPTAIGPQKSRQLAAFIRWALLDNPDVASTLGYVPLPSEAATRIVDRLDATLAAGRPGSP